MKIAFNPSTVAALTTPPNNKDITFDLRGRNIFARGVKFCGTDTNTWRDIKINNVSIGSHTLDLRNGSNTTLSHKDGVVTINSTWRPVVDNLTSDSTTSSLSANQGRVLVGLINGKSDSNHNHDGRYLKLTGGTLTGNLIGTSAMFSGRFYGGGDDEGIIIKPSSNGYAGLILGAHDGERSIFYYKSGNAFWRYSNGSSIMDIYHPKKSGTIALTSDIPNKGSWNYDDRYLRLTGGTMQLGEGLKFHANDNYFGAYEDARIISLLDNNDNICDGGLIIDERATLNGKEYVTELLRIRDSEFKWRGADILHSGNYSGILDSRYYTESEVNNLLAKKLDRVNLSVGSWNPRNYHLAADYFYNGGDLSISETGGQIHVSVDGYFWQDEGKYRVLDTSDVADLKGNLTARQYLSATNTAWYPLIWGGSSHNNTSDSTGAVYKSHDKLSWQTSSQTLYATRLQSESLNTGSAFFRPGGDSTLKIYSGRTNDNYNDGCVALQTSIDGTDGETHPYPTQYQSRCTIALQPRGGAVYIGTSPSGFNSGDKLYVAGQSYFTDIITTPVIRVIGTSDNMAWNRGSGRIVFVENVSNSQAVSLVYTSYDSVRAPAGIRLTGNQGNEWFEASRLIKTGSNDNYVLLGGGGHKTLSDFASSSHSHNYAANENYGGFTKSGRLPISGFYQSYESESGGNAPWSSWMHLINCQHSNTDNNYALQIAASFYDNNTFKIRVTANSVNNAWRDIIHSGNIGSQTVANAYHLRINSANTWSTWYWAGQSGQPSWLWGSNDGTNMYVWNPNNFNVNTAQYLRSLGNQNCQTGRTQNYGDVYSYNTYSNNTGSPTSYTSVIGFGRGIGGTVEIAGGWCNTHLYWRSLRDCYEDWYSWRIVLDSSNYTEFINNYYWANVKISTSSSTTTSPTVSNLTATNSIRLGDIHLEHTNEINSYGGLLINYRSSADVDLCQGGGNVCIGATLPTQKLDVRGNIITKGFGIQPYYLSKSVLPTISPGDGYIYKCLEIDGTTEISCIIADRAGLMNERGILIKFNKGYDGQIILLKDLQNYGSGNGYFWVMPSGCKIIKADSSSILIGQNQISNTYDDGHSRFLVYSSVYSVWIEFLCS